MKTKIKDFTGENIYVGFDVHKKSWTYHYQTDLFDGKTITQPANPQIVTPRTATDKNDPNFLLNMMTILLFNILIACY